MKNLSNFYTDNPITGTKDSPDQLHRMAFSKRVGDALLLGEHSPCLVASLEGKWGYGKTSVINLILKYYETFQSNDKPIVLKFNPWMVGTAETLVQEFLTQLASTIGLNDHHKDAKEAAGKLLSYSNIFTVLKWIPGAEPWASIMKGVTSSVGEAVKSISDLEEINVDKKKKTVVDALGKLKRPIVVFIDDLDRLPPSEVFQMVRLIKAISDFPRISYLLAFDPDYIKQALEKTGVTNGAAYLDKIIQVRIGLPQINHVDIESLIANELNLLADEDLTRRFPGEKDRLGEILYFAIKPLLKTPRDIKRVFNRLRFSEVATRGNVAFSDLFALETLAIKAPTAYEHIKSNPIAYTGRNPGDIINFEEPEKLVEAYQKQREDVLKALPEYEVKYVQKILEYLFPLTKSGSYKTYNIGKHRGTGRVSCLDTLIIALSYGVPVQDISLIEINEFLKNKDGRESAISEALKAKKIERFIELLNISLEDNEVEDPYDAVIQLSLLSETDEIKELMNKEGNFGEVPITRRIWWVIKKLLEKMPDELRKKHIIKFVADVSNLTMATELMIMSMHQRGYYSDSKKYPESECWLNNIQFDEVRDVWIKTTIKAFQANKGWAITGSSKVFFVLKRLDLKNTKMIVEKNIDDDKRLDRLVRTFGRSGADSIKGHYSQVSQEFLEEICGAEKIRERAKERIEKGKNRLSFDLKAIYKSILTGDKYYLADSSLGEKL